MKRIMLLSAVVVALVPAGPVVGQEKTREHGQPQLDGAGDPLPPGAIMRLGTTRLRQRHGVGGVAFTPDGKYLVSCGWRDSIRFWDVQTARQVRRFKSSGTSIAVAFSPDGTRMASVGEGENNVRLWDLTSGEILSQTTMPGDCVYGVAFTPDGRTFATAGGEAPPQVSREPVRLWDSKSGEELLKLRADGGGDAHPIAFSPDGKLLAAGAKNGTIRVWNLAEGTDPLVIEKAHGRDVISLAFMPDGKRLISSGGRLVKTEQGQYRVVSEVFQWQLPDATKVHEFKLPDEPLEGGCTLALSSDGTILATTHYKQVVLWNVQTHKPVHVLHWENHRGASSQSLAISPDNRLLASKGNDNKVEVWDVATGRPLFPQADSHHGGVLSIDTSPDGKLVATGGEEGDVHVWDVITGRHVRKLLESGGWTRSVRFMPDGERVVAAGEYHNPDTHRFEGIMRLVRVSDGAVEREWSLPDRALCAAVSADGNRLAVGLGLGLPFLEEGGQPEIRVWDLTNGQELPVLKGHTDRIHDIRFDADASVLWSTSDDGTIRKWNVENGKELDKLTVDLGHEVERLLAPKSLVTSDRRRIVLGGLVSGQVPDASFGQLGSLKFDDSDASWINRFPDKFPSVLIATPDESLLAVSLRARSLGENSRIALFRMTDGKEVLSFDLEDGVPRSLAFSPDGQTLYSGMDRGDVLVWDVSAAYE